MRLLKSNLPLLFCLLLSLNPGCAREASPAPPPELPAELAAGRLVTERGEGVWLRDFATGEDKLLAADGNWPRWSADGEWVYFVRGNQLCMISRKGGNVGVLYTGKDLRALAVPGDTGEIWFTEEGDVRALNLQTREVRTLLRRKRVLELGADREGRRFAATLRVPGGYLVQVFSAQGVPGVSASGCSANLSPDGRQFTVNIDGHRELVLFDAVSGEELRRLPAPEGHRADNQTWPASPDWILSMSEGRQRAIWAHRLSDAAAFRLTDFADHDRPDLWLPPLP